VHLALIPMGYLIFRAGWPWRVVALAGVAYAFLENWRMSTITIIPFTFVVLLVELAPGERSVETERSLQVNALWAVARLLFLPIPFAAGYLISAGAPQLLRVENPGLNPQTVAIGVLTLLAIDFTGYWSHRIRHKVPILWRFHEIHHCDESVGVLTARRHHSGDKLFSDLCRAIPIAFLGPAYLSGFLGWSLLQRCSAYWSHSRTSVSPTWMEWLFVTPRTHIIHHSTAPEHMDRNFGGLLTIWDRLFRTHVVPDGRPFQTGVPNSNVPNENTETDPILVVFAKQFMAPFRRHSAMERSASTSR